MCPPQPKRQKLWQQNLNKSRLVQEDLINSDLCTDYDIILLQELYMDSHDNTKVAKDWRAIYLMSHLSDMSPCTVILISTAMVPILQPHPVPVKKSPEPVKSAAPKPLAATLLLLHNLLHTIVLLKLKLQSPAQSQQIWSSPSPTSSPPCVTPSINPLPIPVSTPSSKIWMRSQCARPTTSPEW